MEKFRKRRGGDQWGVVGVSIKKNGEGVKGEGEGGWKLPCLKKF